MGRVVLIGLPSRGHLLVPLLWRGHRTRPRRDAQVLIPKVRHTLLLVVILNPAGGQRIIIVAALICMSHEDDAVGAPSPAAGTDGTSRALFKGHPRAAAGGGAEDDADADEERHGRLDARAAQEAREGALRVDEDVRGLDGRRRRQQR